jgi:hypothetical protein
MLGDPLLGAQFHSHDAAVVTGIQQGAREQGAGIALQRLDKDPLRPPSRRTVSTPAALITSGIAYILPVARSVDGADKALRVDKGLQ